MSSGQEGLMAVREDRVREGGVEMTNTTIVASTDEGGVFQPTEPKVEASEPAHPTPMIHPVSPPSSPLVVSVARKKNCSDCLKKFCCLYDRDSKWYELKGKGFWCVLFLLLGYLIAGCIALFAGILCCLCKICCSGHHHDHSHVFERRDGVGPREEALDAATVIDVRHTSIIQSVLSEYS